jgi:hypothetical protein
MPELSTPAVGINDAHVHAPTARGLRSPGEARV